MKTEISTLGQLLQHHAAVRPDADALVGPGEEPLTYSDLFRQVSSLVGQLRSLGVSRSDRVAIVLPGGQETSSCLLAVASGAAAVPLNPGYRAAELERYMAALKVGLLISRPSFKEAADAAGRLNIPLVELGRSAAGELQLDGARRHDPTGPANAEALDLCRADDTGLVFQTSGTTSTPKGVPFCQRNLIANARNLSEAMGLREQDISLDIMPLFHVHGLVVSMLSELFVGGTVVCPAEFSGNVFFDCLQTFRPTWYSAAPTFHQAILEAASEHSHQVEGSSLRLIRSSAAPLPRRVFEGLESTFRVAVVEGYGMSECPQISLSPPDGERRGGAVGFVAGPDVRIVDKDGKDVASGETGEILIRGSDCVIESYDDPADTARAFGRGWLHTGDLGTFDQSNQLHIAGRLREMINRGGEKIAPREIEDVLLQHAEVAQAVVFPVGHPRLGEEVWAAVVLRREGGASEDDLRRHVAALLADHKVPNVVRLVDEIPKGPSGKPKRERMAKWVAATGATFEPVSPTDEIERFLADLWGTFLNGDDVSTNQNFFEAGGDSILAARILSRVRDRYGSELSLRAFFEAPTIVALAASVRGAAPASDSPEISSELSHRVESEQRDLSDEAPVVRSDRCASSDVPSLSLFFFSAEQPDRGPQAYELLLQTARFADQAGFSAVWTPERHFTTFGGPYPNPSVLGAALAAVTERIEIRAGSVVLPLHDPVRVAEEWAVVDNLSGGRVGIAAASGWHANDFVFFPEGFEERKEIMFERLETLRRLWRGETVQRHNGAGQSTEVSTLPRPVRKELPIWLAAHSDSTFISAGEMGFNVLTSLYNTSVTEMRRQVALYRQALLGGGRDPASGTVTLMVHTYVAESRSILHQEVGKAFARYLDRSLDQQESAGWAFPTRKGNRELFEPGWRLCRTDRQAIIDRTTGQLLEEGSLVGTESDCRKRLSEFAAIGVDEVACLIDFGVTLEQAMASLRRLKKLSLSEPPGKRLKVEG